jgi:hypothetical protein
MYQIPLTSKLSRIAFFKMAATHLVHLVTSVVCDWLVSECRQIIEGVFVVAEVSGIQMPCGGECAAHLVTTVLIFKLISSNGEFRKIQLPHNFMCCIFSSFFVSVVFRFVFHKHLPSSIKLHEWCVAVLPFQRRIRLFANRMLEEGPRQPTGGGPLVHSSDSSKVNQRWPWPALSDRTVCTAHF